MSKRLGKFLKKFLKKERTHEYTTIIDKDRRVHLAFSKWNRQSTRISPRVLKDLYPTDEHARVQPSFMKTLLRSPRYILNTQFRRCFPIARARAHAEESDSFLLLQRRAFEFRPTPQLRIAESFARSICPALGVFGRGKKGSAIRKVVQKEEPECTRRIRKSAAFREINTKHTSVAFSRSPGFISLRAEENAFPSCFPGEIREETLTWATLAPFREGCTSYRTETSGAAVKSVHSRHGRVIKFPDILRKLCSARYNCEKCVTDRRSLYPRDEKFLAAISKTLSGGGKSARC